MNSQQPMSTKLDRKESQVCLFDRLCWDANQELKINFKAYKDSIERELEVILNTRPTALDWDFDDRSEFIVRRLPEYFGLHDFTLQQAASELGRHKVAQEMKTVIELYEQRLSNIFVKFDVTSIKNAEIIVKIAGDILYQNTFERAFFPIRVVNLFQNKP